MDSVWILLSTKENGFGDAPEEIEGVFESKRMAETGAMSSISNDEEYKLDFEFDNPTEKWWIVLKNYDDGGWSHNGEYRIIRKWSIVPDTTKNIKPAKKE